MCIKGNYFHFLQYASLLISYRVLKNFFVTISFRYFVYLLALFMIAEIDLAESVYTPYSVLFKFFFSARYNFIRVELNRPSDDLSFYLLLRLPFLPSLYGLHSLADKNKINWEWILIKLVYKFFFLHFHCFFIKVIVKANNSRVLGDIDVNSFNINWLQENK